MLEQPKWSTVAFSILYGELPVCILQWAQVCHVIRREKLLEWSSFAFELVERKPSRIAAATGRR